MRVASVVGARPQFIKFVVVSSHLRKRHEEVLIHTGQHYDYEMSQIFFSELNLPEPDYNLGVGSGTHGYQTGEMLFGIEKVLIEECVDCVMVYGDTNSTLAGALAAVKLHIPVAHVEAGLRSFNRAMPEEINRVVTDHISQMLFCPTKTAVENLRREGIGYGIYEVGDVMADLLLTHREEIEGRRVPVDKGAYILSTIHRAENTDNPKRLRSILNALSECHKEVILPLHPRTRSIIEEEKFSLGKNVHIIQPVGYFDFINLLMHAEKVLTDSGGVQKEAYILGVPCITLRDETEWVETVENGWNVLVGAEKERILCAIETFAPSHARPPLFGDGKTGERIVEILEKRITK